MAKATVLACDKCGDWDSVENPVRRVTVAGPKFELCARDRAWLLVHMGVPETVAVKYQAIVNERAGKNGALPPLTVAITMIAEEESRRGDVPSLANEADERMSRSGTDVPIDPDQTDVLTALQVVTDGSLEDGAVSDGSDAVDPLAGPLMSRNEDGELELHPTALSVVEAAAGESEKPTKSSRRVRAPR
jgi:hypothetical protein